LITENAVKHVTHHLDDSSDALYGGAEQLSAAEADWVISAWFRITESTETILRTGSRRLGVLWVSGVYSCTQYTGRAKKV